MLNFLYNNIIVFLVAGFLSYTVLWVLCSSFYKKQIKGDPVASILLRSRHSANTPMLDYTENFGNIKFYGFKSLLIYLILGIIDFFISSFVFHFIFSLIILYGVINSLTHIIEFNRECSLVRSTISDESNRDLRLFGSPYLKYSYISLLIFRCIIYISYLLIF